MGSVELHVSDLAVESSEDPRYPYKSIGVKAIADPIRLDKANSHKGTLHYTAEFIPSLNVKFEKFESSSEAAQVTRQQNDDEGGYVSSGGESDGGTPVGITIMSEPKSPITPVTPATATTHKKNESLGNASMLSATSDNPISPISPTSTNGRNTPPEDTGIEMSHEELLTHRKFLLNSFLCFRLTQHATESGIIVFNAISGDLHKKARLEVLLDDGYWPCFSTVKARSTHAQWDYVGEGFIKEVDFGRVWLRLNEADENEKDDVIAEWKGDAKEFLQATMVCPYSMIFGTIS